MRRWRWQRSHLLIVFLLLATALASLWQSWPDGQFHLWAFDVGQGDALFLQASSGEQILVDGGPSASVLVELGKVMPFWDRQIDLVILSHNHADHLTGLLEVVRRYQIGEVWISGAIHTTPEYTAWLELLQDRAVPTTIVAAGQEELVGNLQLTVLHPLTAAVGLRPANQHATTIVIRVRQDSQTILLTGDLEPKQEEDLIQAFCPDHQRPCPVLAADVLKVPHHGSRTGLEPDFLAAVAPRVAIISAGVNNPYHHPHPTILERLKTLGIPVWRTDLHGTLEVQSDGTIVPEQTAPPETVE